jgi:predicted phosphodiesterase
MRIAIFSDVHGNLSAMRAVLASIGRQSSLDQVVFAGDLCLFGPRPQATVDLLRERALPAKGQLSAESLRWLDDLRTAFQIRIAPSSDPADELLIVHANPKDLMGIIFPSVAHQQELYNRIRQPDDDLSSLLGAEPARTIAFGHLHIPGIRLWNDKQLINISSVSLPGDRDGRAKYAILTWGADLGWTAELIRVDYPVKDEIEAYREQRPPGWQQRVEDYQNLGYSPQVV